jgi:hypothetical protein
MRTDLDLRKSIVSLEVELPAAVTGFFTPPVVATERLGRSIRTRQKNHNAITDTTNNTLLDYATIV